MMAHRMAQSILTAGGILGCFQSPSIYILRLHISVYKQLTV